MLGLAKLITAVCAAAVIAGEVLAGCGNSHGAVMLPQVSCGSAATHALNDRTQLLSASPGALPCFDAAARKCRAASISVVAMGVDAGTHYVFMIKPGTDPCQITERSQFYLVSGGMRRGPVITRHCRVGAVTARGVSLSCDGQPPLLVPVTVGGGEAVG